MHLRLCAGLFCEHVGENVQCFREQGGSQGALTARAGSRGRRGAAGSGIGLSYRNIWSWRGAGQRGLWISLL